VCDARQSELATARKHALKLRRWVAEFRGVEADTVNARKMRHRLLERRERIGFGQMPQEAHDEPRAHAQLTCAIVKRAF
jgi:hypothetical protein